MICIVSPFERGIAPSERFRIDPFLSEPILSGHIVRFLHFFAHGKYSKALHPAFTFPMYIIGLFRRVIHLVKLTRCDYALIHREAIPFAQPVFEWFLSKVLRKKIFYDFDDALWTSDQKNESLLKKIIRCRWKYKYIIKWSHTVLAGNRYLADFAKQFNSNVIVLPTVVNTNIHKRTGNKKENQQIIIGWTGSLSTMKYLDAVYELIEKVCIKHNTVFKIISNQAPTYKSDLFQFVPWNIETEIEDLQDIDIGIMPLPDDEWAKGKCGFKAIQFMSLEIPVLVSPVGVNTEIVTQGVEGFHCHTNEDWITYLERLITSPSLRVEMGNRGREKIIKHYSLEAVMPTFRSLFE
jgi:glycosyltransferase involved in cell wall biosynthesis